MHSSKRATAVAGRRTTRMKELTNRNYFEHINDKSGISILEFYSPSCTYCKKMEGALTKLEGAKEVDATFIKCNTADEVALALRYDISSVPTIIILNGDKEVNRFIGFTHPLILKDAVLKLQKQ
ncbi:thioredoxin family protein [Agathobacter sp.]|uniref:thioredoxin family protein n=1 Tax=Agathobacter sp. TaxID=2021311 RepID=UPI002E78B397|nr:thioredoxin family protein [Agathobacter sp.]